jgi:hypothetical protein
MAKHEFYPVFMQGTKNTNIAGFGTIPNQANFTPGSSEAVQFYNPDGSEAFRLVGIGTQLAKGTNALVSCCFDTSRGNLVNADPAFFEWPELLTVKLEYQGVTYTYDKAFHDSLASVLVSAYGDYLVVKLQTVTSADTAVFSNALADRIDIGDSSSANPQASLAPQPLGSVVEYDDPLPAGITAGGGWKMWAYRHRADGSGTPEEGFWGYKMAEILGVDYVNNTLWTAYPSNYELSGGTPGTPNIFQNSLIIEAFLIEAVKVTYLWDGDGGGPSIPLSNKTVLLTSGSGKLTTGSGTPVNKTYTKGYWVSNTNVNNRIDFTETSVSQGEITLVSGFSNFILSSAETGSLVLFDSANNLVAAALDAQIQP